MSSPAPLPPLEVSALARSCDPVALGFASTEEVPAADGGIGQKRAREAIAFALATPARGYNIFATGPIGTGKRSVLEAHLRAQARERETPGDWVYLHNFAEPHRPLAVALPCGQGRRLAGDMRRFLDDARHELTAALESDTYAQRQREAAEPFEREQQSALAELRAAAQASGIAVELTPAGVATIPVRGGRPMTPAEFAQLPEGVRDRYQHELEALAPTVEKFVTRTRALQREARDRLRAVEREVALFAIGHLIDELKSRYAGSEKLVVWLDAIAEDVTENLSRFQIRERAGETPEPLLSALASGEDPFGRYEVNVLVAHDAGTGAPVVFETNPTYPNLFGRIAHRGTLGGGLVTDHRMLRPGAVHRANGGYLMLPATEVLSQPLVWRALKEALRSGTMRLENAVDQYALLPTTPLSPEPVALDLKVVLVGAPPLYQLVYALDEDFRKLFRVKAEFDSQIPWDAEGEREYASFLAAQATRAGQPHFDAGAVALIVEHGARLVSDRERLSTRFGEIAGVAVEAGQHARADGSGLVRAEHVRRALEHRVRRSNLLEERLLEMVQTGELMIDVSGERIGQVNGLAVLDLGDYAFGHPVRITATAGPGRGALVSIERESELSGPIHDKGFLTLTGYLRFTYGTSRRIALAATLTFEQSYQLIDGDSAASAELYALLSVLADAPVRQDIAVTGSVNQHGELQAIGGVNEKIEGFYRACGLHGLAGTQGVLIPQANVRNLMLPREIVDSVREGRFHVWSAPDVDRAIELLTGVEAGARGADGSFREGTIHARVERRLAEWAELAQAAEPLNGAVEGRRLQV